jgi:cyclic lactone autoinducer peptide
MSRLSILVSGALCNHQRLSQKGKVTVMKKIVHKILIAIAKKSAVSGAGLASDWGYYQPKVPEKLVK